MDCTMTTYLSWKNKCSRDWRRNCSIFAQKPGRCIYFWGKTHLICYSTFLYKSRMISRREGKTLPMLERVNCWLLLLCLQLQRKDGRRLVYLSQVSEKGLFAPGLCDSLKHLLLQLTRIRLGSPGSSLNPVFDSSLFTYDLICSSQPLAHALSHVLLIMPPVTLSTPRGDQLHTFSKSASRPTVSKLRCASMPRPGQHDDC